MARRKTVFGACHICGENTKLSFEHVPPRAAFNNSPVVSPDIAKLIDNWTGMEDLKKGRKDQLGSGGYTLCKKCNSLTGSWYGAALVEWTGQIAKSLYTQRNDDVVFCPVRVYPLRIIKQVVCMFFSTNGGRFRTTHEELVRFVLNKKEMHIKPGIKIYAFITNSPFARQSGIAGSLNLEKNEICAYSEIAFRPLGYVMTFSSKSPDEKLVDITDFASISYDELKEFTIKLPVLSVRTFFPGDYRTSEEISKITY